MSDQNSWAAYNALCQTALILVVTQAGPVDTPLALIQMKHVKYQGERVRELIKSNAALLFAGVTTFVLMGAGQSLFGPALPAYARLFDITSGTAGLLVSAHWIGCFAGVTGMFFKGQGVTPRHVVLLMGLGAGMLAFSVGWWMTLVGAFVFGMGYGCSTVVFNPRVLRAFGDRGPSMLSLLNATFGIGAIGAPLVFVLLNNDPALSFGVCAALAAAIWLGAGAAGKSEHAPDKADVLPYKLHLPILGFGAAAIGLEACLIGLGPIALIAAGETEVQAAKLLSAFFFAFLAARVALIFVAHRVASFTLFLLALAGACLTSLGAAIVAPGPFFAALGFCAGLFFPGFYVTASRKMGQDSRVAPTIIAAGLVGGIFSPLILSPWLEAMGERGFFWVVATITGLMALLAIANLKSMNR
ncbi:MAG: sugar MFS transporter [Microgenomates group bacterium]